LSVTSVDQTARAILTGNLERLWEAMPDERMISLNVGPASVYAAGYADLMKRALRHLITIPEEGMVISRDELVMVFEHCVGGTPHAPNKVTSFLRHHGIKTKRVRAEGELTYGIEVVWHTSPEWAAETSASFVPPKPAVKPVKPTKPRVRTPREQRTLQ
jgi:hypothetical protein